MEQKKKPTNAQLERRIKDAVVFVPRDKSCKEIYFDDKGLRLIVNEDYCIIATGAHRHIFDCIAGSSGYSRPYLYTQRMVDIALENDCTVKDKNGNPVGHSYALLMQVLKDKEDKSEFNIATFVDWWLMAIFNNLYIIDETAAGNWFVFLEYTHAIVKNSIILDDNRTGLTNKAFLDKYISLLKECVDSIDESYIISPETKESIVEQESSAIQEQEMESAMKNEIDE